MLFRTIPPSGEVAPVMGLESRPNGLAAMGALVILALALISVALPMATIGIGIEKSYNEGWNAYHAARVAAGEPLYTGDPARLVNYPFLSFYLVAWLKPIFHNVLLIGRGLNAAGFAMTAIFAALIVRALGGRGIEMLFTAACVIGFQAIQADNWIGADEPQMLAEALMLGGLLCYVSGEPTVKRLAACAGLFAAGGFVKQILIAIPLAVSVDLALKDRRQFAVWCLLGAMAVAVFVGFSEILTGNGFWREILGPPPYCWSHLAYHGRKLIIAFKEPILASAIYLSRPLPSSQKALLRSYGLIALISSVILSGGCGVADNIYLDLSVFMGLIAGLALGRWRQFLRTRNPRLHSAMILPLVLALPIVTRSPHYGRLLLDLPATMRYYSQLKAGFNEAEIILRRHAGPALCENLLLCLTAGKPLVIDPFAANSQILVGRFSEATLINEIARHRLSLIELPSQIYPDPQHPDRIASYLIGQGGFNKRTLEAIDRYYSPIFQTDGAILLAPRGISASPG
jgi:hypothetical protein